MTSTKRTAAALIGVVVLGIPAAAWASGDVYYDNCDAAREAGVAPILEGQPGYRPGLDRDGDGIACDNGNGNGNDNGNGTTTTTEATVPSSTTSTTQATTPTTRRPAPALPVQARPRYTG